MKKLICLTLLLLVALLPLRAGAESIETEELENLCQPLAGIAAASLDGEPYPAELVGDEYALNYLFCVGNLFFADRAQALKDAGSFERYAQMDEDEVEWYLETAFGGEYGAGDLMPDGERLIHREDSWYLGLTDGLSLSVEYAGGEESVGGQEAKYRYRYAASFSDGGSRAGEMLVALKREDGDAIITGVNFLCGEGGFDANWKAEDGSWFSAMAEGGAFFFDDNYTVVGEGNWTLEEGKLTVVMTDGTSVSGSYDGNAVRLNWPDGEKNYLRDA